MSQRDEDYYPELPDEEFRTEREDTLALFASLERAESIVARDRRAAEARCYFCHGPRHTGLCAEAQIAPLTPENLLRIAKMLPAARPASTAGGCDDLSAQTPGPATAKE